MICPPSLFDNKKLNNFHNIILKKYSNVLVKSEYIEHECMTIISKKGGQMTRFPLREGANDRRGK